MEFSKVRRAALTTVTAVSLLSLLQIVTVAQRLRGEAVEHAVTVDGITRKYLVFTPKGFDKPLPVVLALHGGGGNSQQMERYTKFNNLAAKEGFLVVYPEAVDGNWNDGRGIEGVRAQQENIDDVKFVRSSWIGSAGITRLTKAGSSARASPMVGSCLTAWRQRHQT